jgi:peptide chain release factor 1
MTDLPADRMDQVLKRFDLIEARMSAGSDPETYVRLASEYAELQELAAKIRELRGSERELAARLGEMLDKPDGGTDVRGLLQEFAEKHDIPL